MDSSPAPVQSLDLRQYLRPVWAGRWWILVTVAVAVAATYVYYDHKPRQYRSSTSVFVHPSELEQSLGLDAGFSDDRTTANQASLVLTSSVAVRLASSLHYRGDPTALLGQFTVKPRVGQDFIDMSAVDGNPAQAARAVNALAQAYIGQQSRVVLGQLERSRLAAQRQLDETPQTALNRAARESLADRIRQLSVTATLPSGTAEQVDKATPSATPFTPQPRRNAIFAGLLALLLAVAVAFGLSRFDRRIRSLDDLEVAYRMPLLGALPRVSEPAPMRDGAVVIAPLFREACRSLRTNVELAALDTRLRTVLVVSGTSGEGKSTVLRNLALVYAEAGSRVAVVEADVRRPSLVRLLGVDPGSGLTDVIGGNVALEDALLRVPLHLPEPAEAPRPDEAAGAATLDRGFDTGEILLLQSGPEPPNPPVMLGSDRMVRLLEALRESFDIVLLDSAPLLVVSDAVPLISLADGTVVVARLGETLRDAARRMREIVERVPDANPLGVIANMVSSADVAGGYRYYSYSGNVRRRIFRRR